MNKTEFQTYPNVQGHVIGDESRGGARVGIVVENQDTKLAGTAGFPAMVTYESDGWVRFYTFSVAPDDSVFPGTPVWRGPFSGLSEEIEEMN